jgi:hypothetical protein
MFLDLGVVPPLYAFWYCILHAVDSSQIHSTKSTKQVMISSFLTQLHPMNFVPSFSPKTRVLSTSLSSMITANSYYPAWKDNTLDTTSDAAFLQMCAFRYYQYLHDIIIADLQFY